MRTRSFAASLFALGVLLPGMAAASEPITSGEFRNTAQTLEKGRFELHPLFMPSAYGITDRIDVKFGILSLIGGASASLEVGVVDTAAMPCRSSRLAACSGRTRAGLRASPRTTRWPWERIA
jgi:hypothetical protein